MKSIIALLVAVFILSGCQKAGEPAGTDSVLVVLAGSELKDIEPLLPKIEAATGIRLQMNYAGSLDAVEKLQSGEAVDMAWLASNRYAMLVPAVKSRIVASERTMLTPVVLGLKQSKADELHWTDNPKVSWKDIADAANQGKFTFAMSNPASSNTGFSALLGLAAALSGKGDALEEKDIDAKRLASFFKAQRLTAGSSGWLADAYLKEQDKVDGLINYASTLRLMNQAPGLNEKLVLIYPEDGIVTADYPVMLVNPARQDAYNKLVAYLRGVEFQQLMAQSTLRRPVNPDVIVADSSEATRVELAFPAKLAVVDAILTAFDHHLRRPTDSTFVLDQSGSMSGERIEGLKAAMAGLSGADTSISGRFSQFRNRERIFLLPFSDSVGTTERFDMGDDAQSNQTTLNTLSARVNSLQAGGGTAIFSSAQQAYTESAKRRRSDPARFYSIVLLTDGLNNNGIDVNEFAKWYKLLPDEDRGIKIFPVIFGEANQDELKQLSDLTGGRTFDSRKSNLSAIFKEIRGYQ
ncbi:MAG: VWA domain-containing protein [Gallionella sp.]|nr:VWA domain-containing protein [Gallionella sp.]